MDRALHPPGGPAAPCGSTRQPSDLGPLEHQAAELSTGVTGVQQDLVLVQRSSDRLPAGTGRWLVGPAGGELRYEDELEKDKGAEQTDPEEPKPE